jgi:hypothetical protein
MPDTLRLAGALLAPHSHQESDLLDGDLYARLAASETVAGLWGFPAAGIKIGQEALSSPGDGVLAVDGDLRVGGSISLDGTVNGVDVSDHATLHERGGSQVVRAARLHSGADAGKPSSGNAEGDVWWAADTDKLYVWNGATWKEIGAAGGGGSVAVEEADVQVVAAASVLDFGAGFDVTESPSGEANIALDLTEAIWTFAQGGFRFRDVDGPLLYTGAAPSNDLFLTGDLDVSGHMALGASAALSLVNILTVNETISGGSQQHGIRLDVTGDATMFVTGGRFTVFGNAATAGQYVRGIYGGASLVGTGGSGVAEGLAFAATANAGSATVSRLTSMLVWPASTDTHSGAITVAEGIRIGAGGSWAGAKPTTVRGIYILAGLSDAAVGTAYGLLMEDLAGTTVRLLELGPATPYLRLVGGAAPGANLTNLYLNEGGTLRRVQWKLKSALVDADKVMVLV